MYGIHDTAKGSDDGIFPEIAKKMEQRLCLSTCFLPNESDPVIWRAPIITSVVTQFWTDVIWGDLDYLFVDMPPGTGDVPLTVFQSLPVNGAVIVTSPQDLVRMIVEKAYKMVRQMNIPVLGIVENYSYLTCPDCGKKISVFGEKATLMRCRKILMFRFSGKMTRQSREWLRKRDFLRQNPYAEGFEATAKSCLEACNGVMEDKVEDRLSNGFFTRATRQDPCS